MIAEINRPSILKLWHCWQLITGTQSSSLFRICCCFGIEGLNFPASGWSFVCESRKKSHAPQSHLLNENTGIF